MVRKNLFTLFTGTALAQVIAFVSLPAITYLYSPSEFGSFGILLSFVSMALPLASLTLEHAIVPADNSEAASKIFKAGVSSSIYIAATIAAIYFTYSFLFIKQTQIWNISLNSLILFPIIISATFFNLSKQIALRENRFKNIANSLWQGTLAKTIVQIIFGLLVPIFFFLSLGELVMRLYQVRSIKKAVDIPSFKTSLVPFRTLKKELSKYKEYLTIGTPSTLLDVISLYTLVPLLAILYDPATAGVFVLAQRLLQTPMGIISRSVSDYFYREITSAKQKGSTTTSLYLKSAGLMFLTGLFLIICAIIISPVIFNTFFDSSWDNSVKLIPILAPWVLLGFTVSPLSRLVFAFNAQKLKLIYDTLCILVLIVVFLSSYFFAVDFLEAILRLSYSLAGCYVIYFFLLLTICRKHDRSIKQT